MKRRTDDSRGGERRGGVEKSSSEYLPNNGDLVFLALSVSSPNSLRFNCLCLLSCPRDWICLTYE